MKSEQNAAADRAENAASEVTDLGRYALQSRPIRIAVSSEPFERNGMFKFSDALRLTAALAVVATLSQHAFAQTADLANWPAPLYWEQRHAVTLPDIPFRCSSLLSTGCTESLYTVPFTENRTGRTILSARYYMP